MGSSPISGTTKNTGVSTPIFVFRLYKLTCIYTRLIKDTTLSLKWLLDGLKCKIEAILMIHEENLCII